MSDGLRPVAVALAGAIALAVAPTVASKPQRIVSTNVCTDQLVLMLAERARIASLSYLATDPSVSAMSQQAAGLPVNHGLAEEIIPLAPDLVIAAAFTARATNATLRRLGYRVLEVPVATDFGAVERNILAVAEAAREPAKGRALARRFAARVSTGGRRPSDRSPLAALYWANGYTSGTDTLANAVVEAAGFRTLGRALGIAGTGFLALETLLAARPDVVILGRGRRAPALAGMVLRHPALVRALADRPAIRIPENLWLCGTPHVAVALERLVGLRSALLRGIGR